MEVLVVGAGVFGITAALELAVRGHRVRVVDPGPIPRPEAASTDTSRAVRLDYGADAFYTDLAARCLPIWADWNARWKRDRGREVYHRDGFLFLTEQAVDPSGFEGESLALLAQRNWPVERLDAAAIRRRYPQFAPHYVDGYLNPGDGWAASGAAVEMLAADAAGLGVQIDGGCQLVGWVQKGGRVVGVRFGDGASERADVVVLAVGAWTSRHVPSLGPSLDDSPGSSAGRGFLRSVGQAVFYLEVEDPARFRAPALPTWSADISRSGWYGFPAVDGCVKIANHGPGRPLDPDAPRTPIEAERDALRSFLTRSLPELASARIRRETMCLYTDTFDGAFLIDRVPELPGVVVATGGSGHGFKFAPVLGGITADVVEGKPCPLAHRFRWRRPGPVAVEGARRGS